MEVLTDESVNQDAVNQDAVKQAVSTLRDLAQAVPVGSRIQLAGAIPEEQALLLEALGFVLENWPDRATAASVDIDLGIPTLRQLKEQESVILTVGDPAEFQVEITRLSGITPPTEIMACHMNLIAGRPHCCATLSKP